MDQESNLYAWRAYLGAERGGEGVSPYTAAARMTDLAGLPPAYTAVGTQDLFVDENIAYAQRLIEAGVPVEFTSTRAPSTALGRTPGSSLVSGPIHTLARLTVIHTLARLAVTRTIALTNLHADPPLATLGLVGAFASVFIGGMPPCGWRRAISAAASPHTGSSTPPC